MLEAVPRPTEEATGEKVEERRKKDILSGRERF